MKTIKTLTLILLSIFLLNSCSKDDDTLSCPKTENITMIILAIVSITITGFLIFNAIRKSRKINQMSESDKKIEVDKNNNRMSNSMFFKDILEFFGSLTK